MGDLLQPWHLLILALVATVWAVLWILPLWLIAGKAGLQKWVTLIAIFPFFGVIVLYYIALSEWKRPA